MSLWPTYIDGFGGSTCYYYSCGAIGIKVCMENNHYKKKHAKTN